MIKSRGARTVGRRAAEALGPLEGPLSVKQCREAVGRPEASQSDRTKGGPAIERTGHADGSVGLHCDRVSDVGTGAAHAAGPNRHAISVELGHKAIADTMAIERCIGFEGDRATELASEIDVAGRVDRDRMEAVA